MEFALRRAGRSEVLSSGRRRMRSVERFSVHIYVCIYCEVFTIRTSLTKSSGTGTDLAEGGWLHKSLVRSNDGMG